MSNLSLVFSSIDFSSLSVVIGGFTVALLLAISGLLGMFLDNLIDGEDYKDISPELPAAMNLNWDLSLEAQGEKDFRVANLGFHFPTEEEMEQNQEVEAEFVVSIIPCDEVGAEFKIQASCWDSEPYFIDYLGFFTECAKNEDFGAEYERAMDEAVIEM